MTSAIWGGMSMILEKEAIGREGMWKLCGTALPTGPCMDNSIRY